ncbi:MULTISPECIES: flavin reductase family protein [unclassified Micromonospora]|uniref:flavin reductase family protein n=1 Tax=unclassified Micromonospora TaxID=2617518 RepID=UPI001C227478|nr:MULTISPECIES: flavin reductase family protein [unclassified Micromonospora]MBU8861567.1 flavin reductase family protein [Micromonospora sp. WMMB482]MDM4781135.1 flavin reductase family protein [Micromonospora sp. b486]
MTGDDLRASMRLFPTGVVAVTALAGPRPVGLVVGSFFSASLHPAQVGFCVGNGSTSWPLVRAAPCFAVNVLAAGQQDVAAALSRPGAAKFAGVDWQASDGVPVIDDALACLVCTLVAEHQAGDHRIVVAGVRRARVLRPAEPLVFHQRRFATVAGGGYGATNATGGGDERLHRR